ncbi:polysaccharide biosynthesis/export family protein [Candidatus Margulisiibacteriota bacterium]
MQNAMKKLLIILTLLLVSTVSFAVDEAEVFSPFAASLEAVVAPAVEVPRSADAASGQEDEEDRTVEYTIGMSDVLLISVWREPDLKQQTVVRPDGRISFPLAGDVKAAGLSFRQLNNKLVRRLKRYLKYPVVSISLVRLGGRKVIVMGEVKSPGVYTLADDNTIMEALAMAGGLTSDAVKSSVILLRGSMQKPDGKKINLDKILSARDMSENVVLSSEDIVYVPRTFIATFNDFVTKFTDPVADALYIRNNIRDF